MCYIYLIHLSAPISPNHTCQHYTGSAENLRGRFWHHRRGTGAALLKAAIERGIDFKVVRVWKDDRHREQKIKARKNAPLLCPVCNPDAYRYETAHEIHPDEIKDLFFKSK